MSLCRCLRRRRRDVGCHHLPGGLLLLLVWAAVGTGAASAAISLPPPEVHARSTEICLNSRLSYHGGWSGAAPDQMLSDVLFAASRAPLTGGALTLYLANAQNVYLYDPATNSLTVHQSGDQRSDNTAAFEIGISAGNMTDAGAAMHLALLEATALWSGTANQLAACPRASATTYANAHWNPATTVDLAASFGLRTVRGFSTNLVAVSSDGSLPAPSTDGTVLLDRVLPSLGFDSSFAATDLNPSQLSQLLWATYGCTDHYASGRGGLVCASAVANYYLTRHVYAVTSAAVYRYHDRLPPGTDLTTRDHRIELVTPGDVRPTLRPQVAGLPAAPDYLVLCLGATGDWQQLEVGFAAMGAVLEASTLGLGGCVTPVTPDEQAGIRAATGIPSGDLPMAVVSLGPPAGPVAVASPPVGAGLTLSVATASAGPVTIRFSLPRAMTVDLAVYDPQGRPVRKLIEGQVLRGPQLLTWDIRDSAGRLVPSGVYFCRLSSTGATRSAEVVVVR